MSQFVQFRDATWQARAVETSVLELQFREKLMSALADTCNRNGGVMTRAELTAFTFGEHTVRLIDESRGIRNPKNMLATLAVVSSSDGPYSDTETDDGFLHYDYRAGSEDGDNRKLREAVRLGLPLILLRKLKKGLYLPIFPVYALRDDRERRQFLLALDASLRLIPDLESLTADQRRYAQQVTRVRLHQAEFRSQVLLAYDRSCSICGLRHAELLDAAHIVPDGEPLGQPIVRNGLSLCKIHHAAYDTNILGIDPAHRVHVNERVLQERDGPMLRHGIQEMHGRLLALPERSRDHPDPARLELRFERFVKAG